jgi:hypothetical protein
MTTVAAPTTTAPRTPTTAPADVLLEALDDAVDLVARHEDGDWHTGTPTGRLLADLAGLARATVRSLGRDAGTPLVEGQGVVVVRELVTATRLLRRTLAAGGAAGTVPAGTAATAKAIDARLLEAFPAPR